MDWATEVLENFTRLWKRPVRLETVVANKPKRLGHDGTKPIEEAFEHVAMTLKER